MIDKIFEAYFLDNSKWKNSKPEFHKLLGKPLGWFYAPGTGEGPATLKALDSVSCCPYYQKPKSHQNTCQKFLKNHLENFLKKDEDVFPKTFKCHAGKSCKAFSLTQGGVPRGFIVSCNLTKAVTASTVILYKEFINAMVELAFRTHELHNFYETVHPRAVALSTMHSVHRLIRQSLSIEDLLPRIARLASQIVKAKDCTIYLLDEKLKLLEPRISVGEKKVRRTIMVGKKEEGKAAQTGEFFLHKNKVVVPLIKDDVAGILVLENKKDNTPFTRVDLEILKTLSEQAVLAIKNAELFEESERLTEGSIQSINEMLELNQRSLNVSSPFFKSIVKEMARDLHMNQDDRACVEQATSLLDVGHAGISERIFTKSSKLTSKEFEQIKKHPMIGARVLSSIQSLKPVLPIILTHHERYDGKGYPQGIKGEEIPLGGRIIAVVDAFTAMTSERPYRKRLSPLKALKEIEKESGRQFDPIVVKSFLKLVQKHKEWRSA